MPNLKDYKKIVGEKVIDEIHRKAKKFSKKHILAISSTYQGGGVAEVLNSTVFLFNEIGVDFGWRILHGSSDFFTITKKFHNALQNKPINLSERKKKIYYETNKRFSIFTHINHHDMVIVHDPQPLPLINFYEKNQPWIFRLHLDLSNPNPEIWSYLKTFIEKYDHLVVSNQDYKKELNIQQTVIPPAIDPLSPKNKSMSENSITKYLANFKIARNKPIISQVSRFDKYKDPVGVLKIFELVREKTDCQLILLGSLAPDDPEGQKIFEAVEKMANKSKHKNDIRVLLVNNDLLVNCLQRASTVVIQKSIKEGFGLVVSEALCKGTPVVASNIGGIPLQVIDGINGFLHQPDDIKGFSKSVVEILADKKLRNKLGENGKEQVKKNFLITRLILDWLNLFEQYLI